MYLVPGEGGWNTITCQISPFCLIFFYTVYLLELTLKTNLTSRKTLFIIFWRKKILILTSFYHKP